VPERGEIDERFRDCCLVPLVQVDAARRHDQPVGRHLADGNGMRRFHQPRAPASRLVDSGDCGWAGSLELSFRGREESL
jgi:hypothetical protein